MTTETTKPRVFSKGFLPPEVNRHNSDVAEDVNILRFPLGDAENFSLARAAYAQALNKAGRHSAWQTYAPWEYAYLQALSNVRFKAMGDQVSGVDGGFLAPEIWSGTFFGLLRSFTVLDKLPITRFRIPARVGHIPKVSNDISVAYPGENNAYTSTQFKFGQLSYTPRKATALINVPNELMRDAPGTIDEVLQNQGAEAIAVDRDTQLLVGSGNGGLPIGLINVPQVNVYYPVTSVTGTITTTPASFVPSYQHVAQLMAKVEILNGSSNVTAGQAECDGFVAHSQVKQTVYASTRFQDSSARPLWTTGLNKDGGFFGANWALTNVIPTNMTRGGGTNESVIIAGSWKRFVIFECPTLTFDSTLHGQGFGSDQTQVKLTYRYDGGPAQAEAFAVLAGVLV